ncbi:MAG TPA: enoyl-CoA hydratase-related protein, partial [Blastocatellia bacterium]|nr:enoyl-CoA hydratase-related protein [Blastocatellia bacterium]
MAELDPEPRITLLLEDHGARGHTALIIIGHQARHNILNSALIAKLAAAVNSLRDDGQLRALILGGAGERAFIGGADINEMS